jgi:two-component system chemotaxis sensor kinase CheA
MEIDHALLLQTFRGEAEENLAAYEEALLALEDAPGDAELIATIFRATHTLKGNAEALGLDGIAACAHAAEDVLAALRTRKIEANGAIVSLLLAARDAMRTLLADTDGAPPSVLDPETLAVVRPATDAPTRKTLRVDLKTLDAILTCVEELAVARGRPGAETETTFDELREHVLRLRLVPLGPAFRAHARTVRDVAQSVGKRARLVVTGDDVEVDTSVLDALRDPITHMLRNAIDHGMESPEARAAAGKEATGTVTLRARREAGRLVVEVNDDGAGFRRDRILARARKLGLVGDAGASLTDAEVYRLALAHGFSTAETVTELSGRGVGMDVVARAVEALRGTIAIASDAGAGSTITITVPLTLSLVEGFTVDVASESYVVPLESVRGCIELPRGAAEADEASGVLSVDGAPLPFVRLRGLFQLGGERPARENLLLVEHDGRRAGIAVDSLRGQGQTVMKPLAGVLRRSDAVTGTTLLGDGRVALILDVAAILRDVTRRQRRQTAGNA